MKNGRMSYARIPPMGDGSPTTVGVGCTSNEDIAQGNYSPPQFDRPTEDGMLSSSLGEYPTSEIIISKRYSQKLDHDHLPWIWEYHGDE
jgi:hypothetical protein